MTSVEKQCPRHKGYSPEHVGTEVSLRQNTCATNLRTYSWFTAGTKSFS